MKVIEVTKSNLVSVLEALGSNETKGIDTETTGVSSGGREDMPFLLTVAMSSGAVFYYDLRVLPPPTVISGVCYSHNAKFEIIMLRKIGVDLTGDVRCTMVAERLLYNDRLPKEYSLAATAKRYSLEKDSGVEDYIKEHKLYGKKRKPLFHLVPGDIMKKYATKDAWLHLQIGLAQSEQFKQFV